MNGAAIASLRLLGNVATAWLLSLTGDFKGDGKSDPLWRQSSGASTMWFMSGLHCQCRYRHDPLGHSGINAE